MKQFVRFDQQYSQVDWQFFHLNVSFWQEACFSAHSHQLASNSREIPSSSSRHSSRRRHTTPRRTAQTGPKNRSSILAEEESSLPYYEGKIMKKRDLIQ
jgi:hypothetical protein